MARARQATKNARKITSAGLASSEGCTPIGPRRSQRWCAESSEIHHDQQHQRESDGGECHRRILELAVVRPLEGHHERAMATSPSRLADHEVPARAVAGSARPSSRTRCRGSARRRTPSPDGGEQYPIGLESLRHISRFGLAVGSRDPLEHLAAMFVAAELVEAGAGRRQQHGIAGLRVRIGVAHGGVQRSGIAPAAPRRASCPAILAAAAPISRAACALAASGSRSGV